MWGGYRQLQMPVMLALVVREIVAGQRLGTVEGGGGGSARLALTLVWAGAWLKPTHPTVDHLASWGAGGTQTFPCQLRQGLKRCMVPGNRGLRARFSHISHVIQRSYLLL